MHVISVGLSHRSAPLAVRERLTPSPAAFRDLLARFPSGAGLGGASEAVLLATCGRTELFAAGADSRPDPDALLDLLAQACGETRDAFAPYLERYEDGEAVVHLLRVATGLDSLVLGESEILGQVARAYEAAVSAGAAGAVLGTLFHAAIRAGRRARDETAIGANAASVPSVAAQVASRALGRLEGRAVLVIGAGDTGRLAVRVLVERGAGPVVVMNRTLARAEELAAAFGARVAPLEQVAATLRDVDVVVTSTSSPGFLVGAEQVRRALDARGARDLVIMDLAVPRDVDPAVRQLPGVHYFDVDDLARLAEENLDGRRAEVPRVEAIVAEESARVLDWLRTATVTPTIASLQTRAEAIRQRELDRALRRLPRLTEEERRVLEAFSRSLVKKLLHDPTTRLKAEAGNGRAVELARALERLFALERTRDPSTQ